MLHFRDEFCMTGWSWWTWWIFFRRIWLKPRCFQTFSYLHIIGEDYFGNKWFWSINSETLKACQIAWCFAFRPSLDTPSLLWISAVCLSGRGLGWGRLPGLRGTPGEESIDILGRWKRLEWTFTGPKSAGFGVFWIFFIDIFVKKTPS